ncbi:hypothetical protein STIUS_v1c03780 [Spiroplasma sp. TIUS-1]|uniref:hypothetical protein n=1 Tax=Spiroplasma sp. TIUS-1 TaxID=216963 RepID=UPI0013989408|nr:hypothetical protein [Spiroplasma sp. TIUS-1]QHX35932.1 hypothetical protein STIUS_v1c03780 [Spiroplasma sp. TIUS-1]
MKWIKFLTCLLLPIGIAVSIYEIDFSDIFGDRQKNIQRDIDISPENHEEEKEKTIKFLVAYGIDVVNTSIIPPKEVIFQESFVTAKDVVDFYDEYNITKNFYFDKRQNIDIESEEEITIKLIPLKQENVKLLNRFDHNKVNIDYFLNAGLSLEESIKLESLCWDVEVKDIYEIKYKVFSFINTSYRKEFLDYAIEKMIY